MSSKIGVPAILLTSALFAIGGPYAKTQAARADGGASPNLSCTSTAACLIESNSSSGPGVRSASGSGNGFIATTHALGSSSTSGRSAVLGQDLQTTTGDGVFNFGVNGTSTNGTGVQGSGGAAGVLGVGTSASAIGVEAATTNSKGLLIEGSGREIGNGLPVFTLDAFGHAVFGVATPGYESGSILVNQRCGNGTPIFEGDNQNGLAFRVDDCGNVFASSNQIVSGALFVDTVQAFQSGSVLFNSPLTAGYGFASGTAGNEGTNYTATDTAGVTWLYQGYSSTAGKYTIEMGDSGSIYARIFITTAAARVSQKTSAGPRVDTYAAQITQPTLEDFGEAQLNGGLATVRLDTRFAAAMDRTTKYFVTLTPEGDCRGLYVARRDADDFVVRELQGGRSSIAFTYRIVAKPLGENSARLPLSSLPYEFEHKVPPPLIHRGRVAAVPPKRISTPTHLR